MLEGTISVRHQTTTDYAVEQWCQDHERSQNSMVGSQELPTIRELTRCRGIPSREVPRYSGRRVKEFGSHGGINYRRPVYNL